MKIKSQTRVTIKIDNVPSHLSLILHKNVQLTAEPEILEEQTKLRFKLTDTFLKEPFTHGGGCQENPSDIVYLFILISYFMHLLSKTFYILYLDS